MTKRTPTNQGIQMGGGTLTAQNVAVGDNASISVNAPQIGPVASDLEAIRALLRDAGLPEDARAEAEAAVRDIAEEAEASTPSLERVDQALSVLKNLGDAGGSLLSFGTALAPHLVAVARAFGL
ncbi:MAG: hypothetical protein AAFU80_02795 [Pseudomonadota bacterium]